MSALRRLKEKPGSRPPAGRPLFPARLAALPLILLAGLLALLLAYQTQPYAFRLDIGDPADATYVAGFYQAEQNPAFNYRWTRRESFANLYYPGSPYELRFRAVTATAPSGRPVVLRVVANGHEIGRAEVTDAPQVFTLKTGHTIWGPEELALTFRPERAFAEPGGRPELGVALDWVEVRAAGLTLPPPFVLAWWLALAAWPAWLVRRLGLPPPAGWGLAALSLALVAGLYLLPGPAAHLRRDWFLAGLQLGLGQLAALLGLSLLWRKRPAPAKALRWPGPAALLFFGLLLLYLATMRGHLSYGDDIIMEAASANFAAGRPAAPLNRVLPAGFEDVTHSKYGPGRSLVAVPFYWLGQAASQALPFMLSQPAGPRGLITYLVLLVAPLETAGAALALYWLARQLGYSRGVAFSLGALLGLTTLAWHYARTFLSEPLVMLGLALALAAAYAYRRERRWGWAVLGGFALGLAIAARSFNLAVAPFFALYLAAAWWRGGRSGREGWRLALAWGLPVLAWLAVILGWNQARFGTPFETGYGGELGSFTTPLLEGLYGLLFSPGKSLFLYNPVLLLGLAGLPFFWQKREGRGLLAVTGGASLVYLAGYGTWSEWPGGGVWGPRFLVPLLPLLLLPAAGLLENLFSLFRPSLRLARPVTEYLLALVALVTVGLSFGAQLLGVVVDYQLYASALKDRAAFWNSLFNPPGSPLLQHLELWRQGVRPDFSPRFYHDTPFARFTATFQGAAGLLLLALLALALLNYNHGDTETRR